MVVVFSNALVGHGRQSGDSLLKQAPALRRGPVSHLDQAADLRTLRHQRPGELVARSFPPVTGKDSSNLSPCKTSRVALPQHSLPCSNEDNYRVQGPQDGRRQHNHARLAPGPPTGRLLRTGIPGLPRPAIPLPREQQEVAEHGRRRPAAAPELVQARLGERGRHQDGALLGSRHEGPPHKHRPLQINKVADANKDWQWALVLAGISDFARPAEKLSFTQNFALTCTGLIWTRWCLIIKPKNYLLAAVNFFLGLVGIVQVSRILMYESAKKKGLAEVVEDVKKDVKDQVKA